MKQIKITVENSAAIEAALLAANGKAHNHCFTRFEEILGIAAVAEAALIKLVGSKGYAAGAIFTQTSGDQVSKAYEKKCRERIATRIRLQRRPAGWFLIEASKSSVYREGGGSFMSLTPAQAERAVKLLKASFVVLPAEAA